MSTTKKAATLKKGQTVLFAKAREDALKAIQQHPAAKGPEYLQATLDSKTTEELQQMQLVCLKTF